MTAKTESVQYDHPNHTVTVTTISDLDLSGARLLGLSPPDVSVTPSPGPCHGDSSAKGSFPLGPDRTLEPGASQANPATERLGVLGLLFALPLPFISTLRLANGSTCLVGFL